jgi:hypothetical protein
MKGMFGCICAFLILLSLSAPSLAAADMWVVKRVSGIVYFVAPGVEAFRVKRGMVFEKGYTLGTRAGARALVARGSETISVGPNTTFAISKMRSKGGKTTLLQRKGTVEIDVQKRQRPHFTVETPFFAAVVKGTRFTVTVGGKRAEVNVERGVVGVSDFASGDKVDLRAGQRASSAPSRQVGLTVGGRTKPTVQPGRKRAPVFQTPAVENVPTRNSGGLGGLFGNNGNSNGNGNGSSNGNGNGNGNSNGNGNGNGNGNSNGNGNGSSNGNGNGSSNGNGNGSSNGNGNGSSNGNGNGSSNGNGNGSSNGNGNGSSNGNGTSDGGDGNSNGNSNGTSGGGNGNSNGNGNGNSNGNR